MSWPIGGFLADFTRVAPPHAQVFDDDSAAMSELDAAAEVAEGVRRLVEAAREEGIAEGRRLVEAAADDQCRRLAEDYAVALETARAGWAQSEGEALAAKLAAALASLEAALADALAGVVTPLVEPTVRLRTTQGLAVALGDLMAGQNGPLIEIRGPSDLIEPLRAAHAGNAALVLTSTEGVDVVVEAGDTTIRSQLQAWSDRFEKALLAA